MRRTQSVPISGFWVRPTSRLVACLASALTLSACVTDNAPAPAPTPSPLSFYDALTAAGATAARDAIQATLEKERSGVTVRWSVDGETGSVTPLRTWRTKSGVFCREFREVLDAPQRSRKRVACRTDKGVWASTEPS